MYRPDIDWRHRVDMSSRFDHADSQRVVRDVIERAVGGRSDLRLLDVGCGDGRRTEELVRAVDGAFSEVWWVDPSVEALAAARLRAERFPMLRHTFIEAPILDVALPAGHFDVVLAQNSLNVPRTELGPTLEHLVGATARGGRLVLEMARTLSTVHRLQVRAGHVLSGEAGLPVGRSTDVLERLEALGLPHVEHRAQERLTVATRLDVPYAELDADEQVIARWLAGGAEIDDVTGDRLLAEIARLAEFHDRAWVLESEVAVLEAGRADDETPCGSAAVPPEVRALTYDRIHRDSARGWRQVPAIRRLVGAGGPGRRLLDVGCGTGVHLEALSADFRCSAVDNDPAMVEFAARHLPSVDVGWGDVRGLEVDAPYDVVLCLFNVVAYLADDTELAAGLRGLSSAVAPGGLLLVEPYLPAGEIETRSAPSIRSVGDPDFWVARVITAERTRDHHVLTMDLHAGGSHGSWSWREVHRLRTFPAEQIAELLAGHGLTVEVVRLPEFRAPLLVARRPPAVG